MRMAAQIICLEENMQEAEVRFALETVPTVGVAQSSTEQSNKSTTTVNTMDDSYVPLDEEDVMK